MYNAIGQDPLTNAQPAPEQWALTPQPTPPSFIAQNDTR